MSERTSADQPSAGMPRVGFVLGSGFHPSRLIDIARAIEGNGFSSVWCSEDYFLTGGVSGAAVILGATERLTVGTGVLSAYARHPALIAMEAATLASAHPGRFRLGLGAGGLGWLDQQGIAHPRPLSAVRGAVEAVRSLLAGEEITGERGGFVFDHVRLTFRPDSAPPIYLGATGPRMTALAGEIADGLLLSVFSSPEFVRGQGEIMAASSDASFGGPAPSPGGPAKPITTFAFLALDDSAGAARAKARHVLATYLADGEGSVMTDALGITAELRDLVAKGGAAGLRDNMPDDWIDRLAVCGDLDGCVEKIHALGAAGSDEVALAPITTDTLPRDIERLGLLL
jgi:5,10-methylenetetrahydromethanopterin reductase